ncbi:MAG: hypothetical protein ACLPV8_07690 [Steroidobacteraceae bacterium]
MIPGSLAEGIVAALAALLLQRYGDAVYGIDTVPVFNVPAALV